MKLEELIVGNIVILDTSALWGVGKSIVEVLYSGRKGLNSLRRDEIEFHHSVVEEIEKIAGNHRMLWINEVVEEMRRFMNIINQQTEFIKKFSDDDNYDKIELLDNYCDRFYRLLKKAKNSDLREKFSLEQQNKYAQIIEEIEKIPERTSESEINRERLKKHYPLGKILRTDEKIIATAFTLLYDEPVSVITRDKNMIENISQLYIHINPPYQLGLINRDVLPK